MILFFILFLASSEANTYTVGGLNEIDVEIDTGYHIVKYLASYKQLFMEIKNKENVDHIIITDQKIDTSKQKCPETSLYCTWGTSSHITETISVCVNEVYIYIYPSTHTEIVRVTIKTDYVKNATCNDIDRNPVNFCSLLTDKECLDGCDTGCGLLTCQKEKSVENLNIFSVCLKESISHNRLNEICNSHSESDTYKWETCGSSESKGDWLVTIVLLLLISTTVFGGVVVYYQKVYQKYGRPPFRVPRFCPRKLFPRTDEEEEENLRVIQ